MRPHFAALLMLVALAAFSAAAAVLAARLAGPPRPASRHIALFTPWTGGEGALTAIVSAGGRPVRPVAFAWAWLVQWGDETVPMPAPGLWIAAESELEPLIAGCAVSSPPARPRR